MLGNSIDPECPLLSLPKNGRDKSWVGKEIPKIQSINHWISPRVARRRFLCLGTGICKQVEYRYIHLRTEVQSELLPPTILYQAYEQSMLLSLLVDTLQRLLEGGKSPAMMVSLRGLNLEV
ncbi:hypothetical protein ACMFMG_003468 [Clarireedia jacksonii]